MGLLQILQNFTVPFDIICVKPLLQKVMGLSELLQNGSGLFDECHVVAHLPVYSGKKRPPCSIGGTPQINFSKPN